MRTPSATTSDFFSSCVAARHQPSAASRGRLRAPRARTLAAALAPLLAAAASLALIVPSSALAANTRSFETQLEGQTPPGAPVPGPFVSPQGLAIDGADNVWISDTHPSRGGVISEYSPSGGYLSQLTGGGHFGGAGNGIQSIAFNDSSGSLYVADQESSKNIYIFDAATGTFVKQLHNIGPEGCGEFRVATDNSGGPTQGHFYTANNCRNSVPAYDAAGEPVNFSASESYISGNELTGTPGGSFEDVRGIAVDPHGNIYLLEPFEGVIYEFKPSGEFVRELTGAGVPGGFTPDTLAVDPTDENILVGQRGSSTIDEFSSAGTFLGQIVGPSEGTPFQSVSQIAVDSSGYLYVTDFNSHAVDVFLPLGVGPLPEAATGDATEIQRTTATLNATAEEPVTGGKITSCRFEYVIASEFEPWTDHPYAHGDTAPCLDSEGHEVGTAEHPIESGSPVGLHAPIAGLTTETIYPYRIVVANEENPTLPRYGDDRSFETTLSVNGVQTSPASEVTNLSAVLHGSFTAETGLETEYFFQYGTSSNYGHTSAHGVVPATANGTEGVEAPIGGLVPGTIYHFRLYAKNAYGTTAASSEETFTTYQGPKIEGFSTSDVTTTSAVLHAKINPNGEPAGVQAECRFEYGSTTAYGNTVPCPHPLSGTSGQGVEVPIEGLAPGVIYHFRVIAESKWGSVTSEDQSFEFLPPSCPNQAVRQQTGAAYLPDCRAYELVSPGNANGTLLYPGGPNTGHATNPSRFAYTGLFSSLPGEDVIGTIGDLYVATRTNTGWTSAYIGSSGTEAGCVGGPPNDPWSHSSTDPNHVQNKVPTDPSMSRFLDFVDGTPISCLTNGNGLSDTSVPYAPALNSPYVWNADGTSAGRLPSDLQTVPGAPAAFTCPAEGLQGSEASVFLCAGDIAASGDLGHFIFSSNSLEFAPDGLTIAPGSAYDDNLATGEVSLISKFPNGDPIPQDPIYAAEDPAAEAEFIRFPGVSSDGSHILMSTATATTPHCLGEITCPRFTDTPIYLYMSVDDEGAVEISKSEVTQENIAVNYVGMTPDGSKVFFTSAEQLIAEDHDTSADLYMWSEEGEEEGHPLTLISKANPGSAAGAGSSDDCEPDLIGELGPNSQPTGGEVPWTTKCGVLPYSSWAYAQTASGRGGNGVSDSAIAANGDIYFFSPEQLDGDRGVLNQENLYDYREGRLQLVATFAPGHTCAIKSAGVGASGLTCSDGPVARIEVNPSDTHMALVTADRITSYDNSAAQGTCQKNIAGEPVSESQCTEMYTYIPDSGNIVCASCNPNGRRPTSNVYASQDGLFLTDDGRAFFSTDESLVSKDTNEGEDVYEFADGRAQLITSGTGIVSHASVLGEPGLVGVSAAGTDVYFSTYDVLTAEDHNGEFLKFYDARTNGGFAQPPPRQPCAAAEECHGPGTEAPVLPGKGAAAVLNGGNVRSHRDRRARHKKRHRKRSAGHHRQRGTVR